MEAQTDIRSWLNLPLLHQYRLRPDHAFEVVKPGVFVVEIMGASVDFIVTRATSPCADQVVRLHSRSANSSHPVMCQNCSFMITIAYAVNTYLAFSAARFFA
jgi:hypothetical protein